MAHWLAAADVPAVGSAAEEENSPAASQRMIAVLRDLTAILGWRQPIQIGLICAHRLNVTQLMGLPRISAAVCAFSSTSCITQRDVGTGRGRSGPPHVPVTRRPGQHRDSTRQLHRDVPWVRPSDGTAPLDDPGPASPVVREFAPGPGLTGMQISIWAFWTGFPPLTLCAVIRDQLRRQG